MKSKTVKYEKRHHVAIITLNRPRRMNAVNEEMIAELLPVIDGIQDDRELRVLILAGAGSAFCSGADLKDDEEQYPLLKEKDLETIRHTTRRKIQRVTLGLQALEIPTIAMVNGPAMGAGMDWSLACDLRVGSERARFRLGTGVGLLHGTGGTWLLPRVVGLPKALEIFFTGRILEADEAEKIGLLNMVVPASDLEAKTMELAQQIARGPCLQIRLHKLQIHRGLSMDLATALEFAATALPLSITSDEFKEGLTAFREKRAPRFSQG